MTHDVEGTQEDSARVNKVVSRTLYVVPTQPVMPAGTVSEQDPQIEPEVVGLDAPISVWWDQPPCEDPR